MRTNTNHLFFILLSAQIIEISLSLSLSKVSLFLSSAPSMYIQSSPKPGTDSVPFYMDFGSNSKKDLGDLLCPRFQETDKFILNQPSKSLEKTIVGLSEKYQQLRIGDYEFKKFCFLKEDLLNGNWR